LYIPEGTFSDLEGSLIMLCFCGRGQIQNGRHFILSNDWFGQCKGHFQLI